MTTEYLGSDTTKYSLDSGKVVTLTDAELEELGTQNKLYLTMRDDNLSLIEENEELESQIIDKDREITRLQRKIYDLENNQDNMTIEQFDNILWGAGMKIIYKSLEYDVASVDFENKTILIESNGTGAYVPCTHCKLLDGGTYQVKDLEKMGA